MANMIVTAPVIAPASFETRLQLVHEEIQRRKAETNPDNPQLFVARHWVRWIQRNVLDIPVRREVSA